MQSSENDLLKADIFAYLGITNGTDMYAHPWLVMLDEQRRMHPDIAMFSNLYVYEGLLRNFKGIRQQRLDVVNRAPMKGSALALLDMTGTYSPTSKDGDNSRFNIQSAILSVLTAIYTNRNGEAINRSFSVLQPPCVFPVPFGFVACQFLAAPDGSVFCVIVRVGGPSASVQFPLQDSLFMLDILNLIGKFHQVNL